VECDNGGSAFTMHQESSTGSAWYGFGTGYDGATNEYQIRSMVSEIDPHRADTAAFGDIGTKTALTIARDTGMVTIGGALTATDSTNNEIYAQKCKINFDSSVSNGYIIFSNGGTGNEKDLLIDSGIRFAPLTNTFTTTGPIVAPQYKVSATPLLHISVPFRASVANSTSASDVHFYANYMSKYSVSGLNVSGVFDANKLRAYKHPTAWYIHSISIMYDNDGSTNGTTLFLATNLGATGQGTPSYTTYSLGSKLSGDICSTYTFSTPVFVSNSNSIRARTQYSSSSSNETSFVFHGYQA